MTATALDGNSNLRRLKWWLERDNEGHRTYHVVWGVSCATSDGPQAIMNATGLPAIGATWAYGGDSDPYAYCWPSLSVQHAPGYTIGEPAEYWHVEQLFTTKPLKRCQTESIEDPLLEPQKVSGSFTQYSREITRDRYDRLLRTSSHQPLQGPEMEFDDGTPNVHIEQNVANLGLSTFSYMYNKVNSHTMWGLQPRCVKLSSVSWERLVYGVCGFYFKRSFDFDIDPKTFDRDVADYSNICIDGDWDRDVDPAVWRKKPGVNEKNPQHFRRYKDFWDENCRVLLDGHGAPLGAYSSTGTGTSPLTDDDDVVYIHVEYYQEAYFWTLGIPTDLEAA